MPLVPKKIKQPRQSKIKASPVADTDAVLEANKSDLKKRNIN